MAVKKGDTVKVHYTVTLTDGTEIDSSRKRNKAMEFTVGSGQMIKGFDEQILGMVDGETKTFTVPSSKAYGEHNSEAVIKIPAADISDNFSHHEGDRTVVETKDDRQFPATIISIDDTGVILDLNHPLAGKDLTFDIELINISS